MKKMKRMLGMVIVLAIILSGCGNSKEASNSKQENNKEVTTTPTAEATTQTAQLYTNYDGSASPEEKHEYTGELTPEELGRGLTELTGLYYTFTSETIGNDMYIDWAMELGLMSDGDESKMVTYFGENLPDYGSQQWFMMDSLWYTLTNNFNVENVYYTMDGGQELCIEGILYNTDVFPIDVPYMGRGFYEAHDDVKGDENLYSSFDAWNSASGSYWRDDNSQCSNSTLQMKQISDRRFVFEFDLMDGSETEESQESLVSFSLYVDDNGVGRYESDPDEELVTIEFYLSEDGQQLTVTHTGDMDISPDGVYNFMDGWVDVSVFAGIEALKCLPSALTSLNAYNQPCTFNYYDELIDDMYYHVEAVHIDTDTIFAEFLIAADLSKIYRSDDGMDSELIFDAEHPFF